jgi:hypothetical protein
LAALALLKQQEFRVYVEDQAGWSTAVAPVTLTLQEQDQAQRWAALAPLACARGFHPVCLAAPFKALHRSRPDTCSDDEIERLGRELAWLERQVNLHGSIVAKAPDVWGQNRLMRHRLEYEDEMRRQLPLFEQYSQAAIRRSDQSFLGMALALQGAGAWSSVGRGPRWPGVPRALFHRCRGLFVSISLHSPSPLPSPSPTRARQGDRHHPLQRGHGRTLSTLNAALPDVLSRRDVCSDH